MNIATEQCCTGSEIVNVLEADLCINGIGILALERSIHTGGGLTALVAGDTKVGVVSYELAIGILAAQADSLAAREGHGWNCIAIGPVGFIMAGRAFETVGGGSIATTPVVIVEPVGEMTVVPPFWTNSGRPPAVWHFTQP